MWRTTAVFNCSSRKSHDIIWYTNIHHAGKALIHKTIKIKCRGGRLAIPGARYLLRVQGRQASVWVLAPVNGIATADTQAEGASVPESSTQRLWRECGHCRTLPEETSLRGEYTQHLCADADGSCLALLFLFFVWMKSSQQLFPQP